MCGLSQKGFISLWVAALQPKIAGSVLIGKKIFQIAESTYLSSWISAATKRCVYIWWSLIKESLKEKWKLSRKFYLCLTKLLNKLTQLQVILKEPQNYFNSVGNSYNTPEKIGTKLAANKWVLIKTFFYTPKVKKYFFL